MAGMTHDLKPGTPEQPRSEPEIIPPDRGGGPKPDADGGFFRFEEQGGVHRVFMARVGWPRLILTLLAVGVIATLAVLLFAGLLLILIPVLVGGSILALVSGAFRQRLAAWRARWPGR